MSGLVGLLQAQSFAAERSGDDWRGRGIENPDREGSGILHTD